MEAWRIFVAEYVKDLDRRRAYLAAYPKASPENAGKLAYDLMQRPYVFEALEVEAQALLEECGVEATASLRALAALAHSDLTDVLSWDKDGVFIKPSNELTYAARQSLKKIKLTRREIPIDQGESMILETKWEVEMHDKVSALEKLLRYLKLLGTEGDQAGGDGSVHFHVYLPGSVDRDSWLKQFASGQPLKLPGNGASRPPGRDLSKVKTNGHPGNGAAA